MNMKTFNITVQGASHVKKGTVCQDHSASKSENGWSYAIVCDGHGGADYVRSDKGSEFGCKSAEFVINSMMKSVSTEKFFSQTESLLQILEKRIIDKWREVVASHFSKNPFTTSELSAVSQKARDRYANGNIYSAYGTTLVAVVMTHDYWFAVQIGDGKVISIDHEGNFYQPVPENPKCFANATASMCDSDAFENFRGCFSCDNPEIHNSVLKNTPDIEKKNHFIAYGRELPSAVIVSSDGIDNCFKEDEQMYNLYKTVLYSFGTSDFGEAENNLKQYLPKLSQQGSGDDISVSAILDIDVIPELSIVKEYDMNKQKQRVVDAKRRQQEADEAEKKIVAERVARLDREKIAELQGKVDQLEKFLKQEQEGRQQAESRYNQMQQTCNLYIQKYNEEYNAHETERQIVQAVKRSGKTPDAIRICLNCGKLALKEKLCMKCRKPLTEYKRYSEDKKNRPFTRKPPLYPDEQDYRNPYPDEQYYGNPYPDNYVPDDYTGRKGIDDIDVPIHENNDSYPEKVQLIKQKKKQEYSDEYKTSDNDFSYEDTVKPDINKNTENPYQETVKQIPEEVQKVSEETEVYENTSSTDADEDMETSCQENSFEVPEEESQEIPRETEFHEDTVKTENIESHDDSVNDIPDKETENNLSSDDTYSNDDDDNFEPEMIQGGILSDDELE